ncbi:YkgJ family cysteine cluster protein [Candidatus Woesearchaeota archaeon]|nr:YkgJ family cysteine cluster protein [Candidatus Woesearchaeota archaeon]
MSTAQTLVDEARNSLGEFCSAKCNAHCFKHGFLELSERELVKIIHDRLYNFDISRINDIAYARHSLKLGKDIPCPCLKKNKCTIYADRPQCCRDFPLFVNGKMIAVAPDCPGIDILKPYLKKLEDIGFKII